LNISIIIPTYNRAHLLGRAIESVLAQTYEPIEIIVVDDGSEDGTKEFLRSKFSQCRYFHQENKGVSSARNYGIRKARGEWLAFLDSDDEWLPGKLAAQKTELDSNPETLLCHTEEIWVRNGKRVNPKLKHAKSGGYIYQKCLPLCVISPSAALIHKRVFTEIGLFDEALPACEDYDMWLRICSRQAVAFVGDPQIRKYGGHSDQLSEKYWGMDRFRIQALDKILQAPHLSAADQNATLQMLLRKIDILIKGAIKRGKTDLVSRYMEKQNDYREMIRSSNNMW
jgi:glycosyltransferase involved in cell wall biosynthesis